MKTIILALVLFATAQTITVYRLKNEVKYAQMTIRHQSETIEQMTVKYIGTADEQKLLREANERLKKSGIIK